MFFDVVQSILNKSKRIFMEVSSNIALLLMGMRLMLIMNLEIAILPMVLILFGRGMGLIHQLRTPAIIIRIMYIIFILQEVVQPSNLVLKIMEAMAIIQVA